MQDIKLIRERPEVVRADLIKRRSPEKIVMLNDVIKRDIEWRRSLTKLNELRHLRRMKTTEIASLKKKGKDATKKIEEVKEMPIEIKKLEEQVKEQKKTINYLLLRLPNILHESVPIGQDENDNVTERRWGEISKFDFQVKSHLDLGLGLDIIDVERAAKVSGARFYYLKNEAVSLDFALKNFALEELKKRGFTPIEPPLMMRRGAYEGVTDLGDFEDVLYKVEDEDLYLIATSEHPMAAMFMSEVLNAKDLPSKYVGISSCFRKEAGAHGKDTKGIFRTHQFDKVEQFVFCKPVDSWRQHEELIKNVEEIYRKLELPFRIVNICTGDIGTFAAKKYDLEVWMPGQNKYREVVSCSNCTDYQARRLNIRYRKEEGTRPKGFVHTLNSTAIAIGRTIVAILENFQQKDGSVLLPRCLRDFMGGIEKLG